MTNLTQLKKGQSGKIVSIEGGVNLIRKLESLGIKEGVTIKRDGIAFGHGPIVVRAKGTQIALGKGMATKIIIEIL